MREQTHWYRQPVMWLGLALLAAAVAGGVATIVVASRYADEPVATSPLVFKMPAARPQSE